MKFSPYQLFFFIALALVVVLSAWLIFSFNWHWLIAYLLGINMTTLLYYAYDKAVAGSKLWRVPEAVLHTLALIGGAPAAFAGQKLLRHKTIKASFQRVFWISITIQVIVIVLLIYYLWR